MINELEKGAWLVVVEENSRSATPIEPDFPELDAALYDVKEEMLKVMREKAEMRPSSVRMSDKEIKAWEAYKKTMGEDIPTFFEYASLYEIAEAGCRVIHERAKATKKKFRSKPKKKTNSILELEV